MTEEEFLSPTEETVRKAILGNVKLSKSFRLGEFLNSQTAQRRGINNVPGPVELRNLYLLCRNVLQPIRTHMRSPVTVSSGLRVPLLNAAVGGSESSQHMEGKAADIQFHTSRLNMEDIAREISHMDIPYDQLILEFHYTSSPASGWIHVSHNPDAPARRQVITIDRHGTRVGLDPMPR